MTNGGIGASLSDHRMEEGPGHMGNDFFAVGENIGSRQLMVMDDQP